MDEPQGAESVIHLADPAVELEAAYLDMVADHLRAGDDGPKKQLEPFAADFAAYVRALHAYARGENLPDGAVPQNTYWLMRGRTILGTARLRHRLNERLEHEGGHVGYGIRPSERGKGCATRLLALMLDKARARGLTRVLVTCNEDNIASRRVIEKNGGRLEDRRISDRTGKAVLRFWIDLAPPLQAERR